jgi:hypothetical protein
MHAMDKGSGFATKTGIHSTGDRCKITAEMRTMPLATNATTFVERS